MKYQRYLKQSQTPAAVIALITLAVVFFLGTWVANQQRDLLNFVDKDIEAEALDIDVAKILYDRRVISLSSSFPTPEDAYAALLSSAGWKPTILNLEAYLQASRVVNSTFRDSPAAALKVLDQQDARRSGEPVESPDSASAIAARDLVHIPWYVVFFGYEQYLCFFLAALCLGELYTIRRRLRAELVMARKTVDELSLSVSSNQLIGSGSAQTVNHRFNSKAGTLVFSNDKPDDKQITRMQRFAWVAMINNLLEAFGRTGDRLQSLEAATSAHESAQARFDGNFHFEQYLQWAIPSIGFLGTIRGIAAAMGAAQVADDLPIVVSYLGVAFYSTLTALILNLILMGIRANTLSRCDLVFADLDESLRRDAVTRLDTK
jgi:hypothetical protein